MYEFIRGPMAWTCFSIFVAGMVFQVIRFFRITRKIQPVLVSPPPGYKGSRPYSLSKESLPLMAAKLRGSILGMEPVMVLVTVVFHFSIFILPLFLSEHNMLIEVLWGGSLCPYVLPERWADILCGLIAACILFFLFRRIFVSRVRAISTLYDYFTILLTATPFVTGFMAVHGIYDYRTLIIIHILSVNLIMIMLPFSKFVHAAFFFLNRFFLASEYGFSRGLRKW